jgi:guanylate kinase
MTSDFVMLILSSPSGAGKTTLCRKLLAEFPDIRFSVSHTTRAIRATETDGRDYHFVSPETFAAMVKQDAFAEWAEVHGQRYGTSKHEIEVARKEKGGILFDIDFQGARQIRATYPEAIAVFVLPPSLEELERRLRTRATDDESTVVKRFAAARQEIASYGLFDYVVVNEDLERAYASVRAIVQAERCRRPRMAPTAEKLIRG